MHQTTLHQAAMVGHQAKAASDDATELSGNVTREDVIWCYRTYLGREPESETAIRGHGATDSWRTLVSSFVNSAEHQTRRNTRSFVPLDAPTLSIDSEATPSQLALLVQRIHDAWSHLGDARPHYSVLTTAAFLPENIAGSMESFWKSGRQEAATIRALLQRHGFSDLKQKTCVEYGSGVGRVTVPLAELFEEVHAYDISDGHLSLAENRAREVRADNIKFHSCAAKPLCALKKCDFFYSRIVFQHNPPPVMRELVLLALRSLNAGGVAIFQLPIYMKGYRFSIEEYLGKAPRLDMEMHCIPQREIFGLVAAQGCSVLEVREDSSVGRADWISNTFVVARPVATGNLHA
jgi:SAM-dependent methyltransferase